MTTFNVDSTLEPNIQFLKGFLVDAREGRFNAPASPITDGAILKVASDGETFELSGTSDGQYYSGQRTDANGPIGSAANREKYMQGMPMNSVKVGTPIWAMPHMAGAVIKTKKFVTGTATGALTALSVTIGSTLLEHYNGEWRIRQSSDKVMGKVIGFDATNGWVEIFLMEGIT